MRLPADVPQTSILLKTRSFYKKKLISSRKANTGCETWSLTLREERRLRVFENRLLRIVFVSKRDEVTGNGENYIMKSLVICTPHRILCGW